MGNPDQGDMYVNTSSPFYVMGLPRTSELLAQEIEEAYQAKAAKLDAADDQGLFKLQAAYERIKQRGKKLEMLREEDRKIDMALMKRGLYGKEEQSRKRHLPTGHPQWMLHLRNKQYKLMFAKSPGEATNNNKSCC